MNIIIETALILLARQKVRVLFAFCVFTLMASTVQAGEGWPHVAVSTDGTPIAYEMTGTGGPCLVFVHGWSCDSRYWRAQVPYFSKKYRVVTLDLAGHGHSGMSRTIYTMKAFGEDVRAVVEASACSQVILIGHSMGGSVIAEAARLMPGNIKGLVGVDTLQDVERVMDRKATEAMIQPLVKDFSSGCRQFVGGMFRSDSDPLLKEWVLSDMSSAPAAVALSAMNNMLVQYMTGEAASIFEQIPVPVIAVNADLWPVNTEANKRHMHSFEAIVLENTGHFLMMNQAKRFNEALEKAIQKLLK